MALDPNNPQVLEELTEIIDLHLTALKYFPGGAGSLAVARLLAELVDSPEQARQLCCNVVNSYDEWPGPATFRRCYFQEFRKELLYGKLPKYTPHEIQCQACQDWGRVPGPDGKWQACACSPDFPPEILERMNRPAPAAQRPRICTWSAPNPPGQTNRTRLITQDELDQILLARTSASEKPKEQPCPQSE